MNTEVTKKNYISVKTSLKAGAEWWDIQTVAGKGTRLLNNETGQALTSWGNQVGVAQSPGLNTFKA